MVDIINIPAGENVSQVYCFPALGSVYGEGDNPAVDSGISECGVSQDSVSECGGEMKFTLERDAQVDLIFVILPEASPDIHLCVELNGENARANVSGIYVCPNGERVNIHIDMRHNVSNCTSMQLFKGIVGGDAKSSVIGKIYVAPRAQKTDALQENHSLLLSEHAEVNTQPQLEIYADDVRCTHGATVGKLDENAQFYMRSRGIPASEAKILQMVSFLAPVLSGISDPALHETLSTRIASSLRSFTTE